MTDTQETKQDAPATEEKVVETYYDEDEDAESCGFAPGKALCEAAERVRDKVLEVLPVEVTEHLVNSQKELLRAGVALAEARMRKADEVAQRARALHTRD